MFPVIEIDLKKLKHNTEVMKSLCQPQNIKIAAVTKCFCAIPEAARAIVDGGASMLADSRIDNLKKLRDIDVEKILLRIPMHSETRDVVLYSDYSLNSEISTLKILGREAESLNKKHKVIIMVDLGDLREGIWADNIDSFINEAIEIKGIEIRGFGVNLTCYGGVIPDESNLSRLVRIANDMKAKYNLNIDIISGGNSSSVYLLKEGRMPDGVNNLRLGEIILFGRETAFGEQVEGMYRDAFVLKGQIVELKEKPSMPIGNIGMDAFGKKPEFVDRGIIKRAIVAMGKQDIDTCGITPVDPDLEILGGSSDHTIINLSNSRVEYKVGDIIEFYLDYGCLLRAATSPYVNKIIK